MKTWFGPQSATGSEKPNIVFVLTDDMRKDDLRFVPETRRLVGNAVRKRIRDVRYVLPVQGVNTDRPLSA
jgi:hypothetical protein